MKKSTIFALIATLSMFIMLMFFIAFVRLSVIFDDLEEIVVTTPDLQAVNDGTYLGHYEVFPLSVDIHVTVSNHQFETVLIEHHSLFFDMSAVTMMDDIVLNQQLPNAFTDDNAYSEKILLLAIIDAIDNLETVQLNETSE